MKDLDEPSFKNLTKGDKNKNVLVNIKEKIDIKKEELEKLKKNKMKNIINLLQTLYIGFKILHLIKHKQHH